MFLYSLPKITVNKDLIKDEKYTYLYSVDALNKMVTNSVPFRDAYKIIDQQIAEGTFKPEKNNKHTHIGSLGNLYLNEIQTKMEKTMR